MVADAALAESFGEAAGRLRPADRVLGVGSVARLGLGTMDDPRPRGRSWLVIGAFGISLFAFGVGFAPVFWLVLVSPVRCSGPSTGSRSWPRTRSCSGGRPTRSGAGPSPRSRPCSRSAWPPGTCVAGPALARGHAAGRLPDRRRRRRCSPRSGCCRCCGCDREEGARPGRPSTAAEAERRCTRPRSWSRPSRGRAWTERRSRTAEAAFSRHRSDRSVALVVDRCADRSFSASVGALMTSGQRDMNRYDAIVIGGGHNGLVAAAYLAKRGARTVVLEARHKTGGAADTMSPLARRPRVQGHHAQLRDEPDARHDPAGPRAGAARVPMHPHRAVLRARSPTVGTSSSPTTTRGRTTTEFAKFSKSDADAIDRWDAWIGGLADVLGPLLMTTPPQARRPPAPGTCSSSSGSRGGSAG